MRSALRYGLLESPKNHIAEEGDLHCYFSHSDQAIQSIKQAPHMVQFISTGVYSGVKLAKYGLTRHRSDEKGSRNDSIFYTLAL